MKFRVVSTWTGLDWTGLDYLNDLSTFNLNLTTKMAISVQVEPPNVYEDFWDLEKVS